MVSYATKDELKSAGFQAFGGRRYVLEKSSEGFRPGSSTFLSHSSKDSEILPGAIKILEDHGASVYIDKKDDEIPPYTSPETAEIIRSRIRNCKKFILLATRQSKGSKWVPWELGSADGYKTPRNVTIFPGLDSAHDTKWTEWEYLGIYKRIAYGKHKNYSRDIWMVYDHRTNTATHLADWLRE